MDQLMDKFKEAFDSVTTYNQKDNVGKIRYELSILKEQNILPTGSKVFQPKDDDASEAARKEGNNFFLHQKDYVSAMKDYNRSICLAPIKSENLAIGYANRSAIYLNAGFYSLCLENIELALAGNYPERLRPKLEERKKECIKLMNQNVDGLERFKKGKIPIKLSYKAHERIPGMIEGLELGKSDQYGRYIRAKQDLYPGDIIIVDKPFFKCVEKSGEFRHCANCFKENYLNLLPCHYCTRAMYCSEDCRQNAWRRFHKYECKIIDGILSLFDEQFRFIFGIRTTLYAFTMFDDPEDLRKLTNQIEIGTESVFDYANLTEETYFRA